MRKAIALRISEQLWEDIRRLASADIRSINAEIEFLLREAVTRRLRGGHKSAGPDFEDDH